MLVDLRNNSSSGLLTLTRVKYREVRCTQIVHKKSYFLYLKKKLKGDTIQVFPNWFNFRSRKKFIQGILFRTRGSGAGLYTDKHCWRTKTNMATVWRFRRGFTSVFSLLVRSQRWSQITDLTKKKYTIFKRSWKYLIGKKCLFLWTICVHRTSLYLMRVGAR